MTTVKSTKKATAKKTTKKPDIIYWVLLERKFLTWKTHSLYTTKATAQDVANDMEVFDGRKVKVERVELVA